MLTITVSRWGNYVWQVFGKSFYVVNNCGRCQTLACRAENNCRYYSGELPPRYPVPATMDNANYAMFVQYEIADWQWFNLNEEAYERHLSLR